MRHILGHKRGTFVIGLWQTEILITDETNETFETLYNTRLECRAGGHWSSAKAVSGATPGMQSVKERLAVWHGVRRRSAAAHPLGSATRPPPPMGTMGVRRGFEMTASDDSRKFYRPRDLVEMGYGSRPTIYRKLDNGTIPSVRIGKSYLMPKDEFDMLLMKERLQRERPRLKFMLRVETYDRVGGCTPIPL